MSTAALVAGVHDDRRARIHGPFHPSVGVQLLSAANRAVALRCIADEWWCAEEKLDGQRLQVARDRDGVLTARNRRGLATSVPTRVVQALAGVPAGEFLLDGELVGPRGRETYHVFDVLMLRRTPLWQLPYRRRRAVRSRFLGQVEREGLRDVPTAHTTSEKQALLDRVTQQGGEGLVLKRLDREHSAGRDAIRPSWLKHKLYSTLSAVVTSRSADRSSCQIALVRPGAPGTLQPLGSVADCGVLSPQPRDIVEVRYLYAFPRTHALHQPVLLGIRTDVAPRECTTAQLKFKTREVLA